MPFQKQWKTIISVTGGTTSVLRVPGGFLVREVLTTVAGGPISVSICFIPVDSTDFNIKAGDT